jgi:hypothetical protein
MATLRESAACTGGDGWALREGEVDAVGRGADPAVAPALRREPNSGHSAHKVWAPLALQFEEATGAQTSAISYSPVSVQSNER